MFGCARSAAAPSKFPLSIIFARLRARSARAKLIAQFVEACGHTGHMTMRNPSPDTSLEPLRILSEAATAQLLSLSAETLRRMAHRGEGPIRLRLSRRRVGYRLRDVMAWLERVNA
jgi:predicted DNA-binding transcriptional regulator AlpA